MRKTSNFLLSVWEESDRIQMSSFNSDNHNIEGALTANINAHNEMLSSISQCGNCKIAFGSYVGTGTAGPENPTSLTFDALPIIVFLYPAEKNGSSDNKLVFIRGVPYAIGSTGNVNYNQTVTWKDKGMEWYSYLQTQNTQFNGDGKTYCYIALLAADE